MKITIDDILEENKKSIYDHILEAVHEAIRNGIKANSIVINDNLVRVPESFGEYPEMICGLKTYRTSCELPEDYAFAVLHDPNREPEPQTNADRIRAMSDIELRDFLQGRSWICETHKLCNECPLYHEEKGCLSTLEWLKQPAEENDNG